MKRFCAVFLSIFIAFLLGCNEKSMYHLRVKNTGVDQLENVMINYENFQFTFGILIRNADAEYSFAGEKSPLPEKATLSWKASDGKEYKRMVDVKSKVPEKFKEITVIFTIDDKNEITVSWKND
jgi:hypothetical protein